jgi:hypothetical protein
MTSIQRLLISGLVSLSLMLMPASRAQAGLVMYDFAGIVTSGSVVFSSFPGATVTGTIAYDTSTLAGGGSTATKASYTTGSITFSVESEGFSYQSAHGVTTVVSTLGVQDSFAIEALDGLGEDAIFMLNDPLGKAFSSSALPLTLDLTDFQPGSGNTIAFQGHHAFAGFDVSIDTLIPAVSVPEPSSLIMTGMTLAMGLIYMSRRKRFSSKSLG